VIKDIPVENHPVLVARRLARLAVAALLAVWVGGCTGNSMMRTLTPPPVVQNASFAFVSNTNSNAVSAFELDPKTGLLFPVMGSPFPAGGAPEFMAADAAGKFLFVANSGSNNISAFQIDGSTGALTPAPGSPFSGGTQPEGLALVSSANLLFVANNGSNDISAFKFDAVTGTLTPVPGSPFPGVPAPMGAATDITGKFLYVTNVNGNSVSAFAIDSASGALTAVAGSPFATGSTPIGLTADPNGMFLYVGDHMSDSDTPADTVSPFSVDPVNGALRPLGPTPALQPNCSSSCHVNPLRLVTHPTGKFAYGANVGANTLSAFRLSNGSLTSIASPVATGQHPFGVALDPTGSFLYVVSKLDNDISGFSVNPATGMLSPLAGAPFGAGGRGPVGIVIVAGH